MEGREAGEGEGKGMGGRWQQRVDRTGIVPQPVYEKRKIGVGNERWVVTSGGGVVSVTQREHRYGRFWGRKKTREQSVIYLRESVRAELSYV